MNHHPVRRLAAATLGTFVFAVAVPAARQAPPAPVAAPAAAPAPGQGRGGPQAPTVVSPDVSADRRITFRLYAPNAQAVRVNAGDIPGLGQTGVMTKGADGVWSFTSAALEAGAYRYTFNVDGVTVIDPRSPAISESNNNIWSVAYVAGSDMFDTKQVPHGAVAAVTYYSSALKRNRRMHVYTPPGYEASTAKYPVFFLLHGAGDSDEAWTSVGRAGIILDNLIAAKKAKPMIVVMPAGHTNGPMPGVGAPATPLTVAAGQPDEFTQDFTTDIQPYVDSHYRVLTGRPNRAIAGLSMGGSQTLNIAIPHLDQFAYVGVFSSGILGGGGARGRGAAPAAGAPVAPAAPFGEAWEKQNMAMLDNAAVKKGLKVLWFSTGKDDGLITTTRSTVDLLKKHGFTPQFIESPGAHTWLNWRNYLVEFTPQLFQ
ncbi:MAG: alpha/beta hydrolase-fold protein [Acidobacteriota bacterium]